MHKTKLEDKSFLCQLSQLIVIDFHQVVIEIEADTKL